MPQPWSDPRLAADRAHCRALVRTGSRSFHAASHLLPPTVRDDAIALYAFCREADDRIDEEGGVEALPALVRRLDRIYCAGEPVGAVERAFAEVVHRHRIPRTLPAGLLEGFAWDLEGRRYDELADLRAYAVRVAGTVGAMMALLMDVRSPELLARACDLGVAMQLTNIARDVGEDARAGRLYLPQRWLRDVGLDPDAFLAAPTASPALRPVVARLLDAAEALYRRADAGITGLPRRCRPGIRAARLIYAEIGAEVRWAEGDALSRRAVVGGGRKAALAARAVLPHRTDPVARAAAPLPEAAFVVQAVTAVPGREAVLAGWPRVIDLFLRLEGRDREASRRPVA